MKIRKVKKIVSASLLAMIVVLMSISVAAAVPWEGSLIPQNSSGSYGENTPVELWVTYNSTGLTYGAIAYQADIYFDPGCVDITAANYATSPFTGHMFTPYAPGVVRILEENYTSMIPISSGTYKMAVLTFNGKCTSSCNCNIRFDPPWCVVSDTDGEAIANTYTDGTYTCIVTVPSETFTKPLSPGWNLISLPLTPTDNSTGAVLTGVSQDAVKRYNATSKTFADATTMDPGTGYFVHVTTAGTWSYNGTAYTSMTASLSQGLNMVGWTNTSADLPGALNSISSDYRYVARWNADDQKYEVYLPGVPAVFNDFTTMDEGKGYFIVATEGCTLAYP